jgi:NADH-quinone oxidoreductase subunit C
MKFSNNFSTQSNSLSPLNASQSFLNRVSALVPGTLTAVVQSERRVVTTPSNLYPLLTILKNHTGREFSQLRDITAIDHPERSLRFEVVYSLLSITSAQRLSVSVRVSEGVTLPSVTGLYSSAG